MNSQPFIAVICGLKSEQGAVDYVLRAERLNDTRVRSGVSGANASRAEEAAAQFCREGARAIFSIGVSGGLDPALRPGDLVLGSRVVTIDGAVYSANENLLDAIGNAGGADAHVAALFGADEIIDSASKKSALFQDYKAIAVDMESHGAAKAAHAAGVPFLAIRAIADPADRALPSAALNAVAPDGSTRTLATLGAALRDPRQLPHLMQLGADSAAALKTLRGNLGPVFRRLLLSLDL